MEQAEGAKSSRLGSQGVHAPDDLVYTSTPSQASRRLEHFFRSLPVPCARSLGLPRAPSHVYVLPLGLQQAQCSAMLSLLSACVV